MFFSETCRLLRLYAANLLKSDVILAAGDNLKNLSLERRGQLTDENLGIGAATWSCLAVLESTHDLKPFFTSIRKFYCETIKKMQKKFPFDDSLMKDLGVLQPENTANYAVSTIISLAKRFPQLDLAEDHILDDLREEFTDFQLSQSDLPSVSMYKAADGSDKPCSDLFWSKVGEMTTFDGQPRFGLLFKLMTGLLCIPCSNADSERGFSMLRKIHTDQQASLDQSTIVALMSIKLNSCDCCIDVNFDSELLTRCKRATVTHLQRC